MRDKGVDLLTATGGVHKDRLLTGNVGVLAARVIVGVSDGLHPVGVEPHLAASLEQAAVVLGVACQPRLVGRIRAARQLEGEFGLRVLHPLGVVDLEADTGPLILLGHQLDVAELA